MQADEDGGHSTFTAGEGDSFAWQTLSFTSDTDRDIRVCQEAEHSLPVEFVEDFGRGESFSLQAVLTADDLLEVSSEWMTVSPM